MYAFIGDERCCESGGSARNAGTQDDDGRGNGKGDGGGNGGGNGNAGGNGGGNGGNGRGGN